MDINIPIGSQKERIIVTNSNQTTSFLWKGENVLSTPSMISEIEETCRLLLKDLLNNEKLDSVGTLVNIRHLAATPVGFQITIKARIIQVNARRILFQISAHDGLDQIGDGKHERFIINVSDFRSKFEDKKKKLLDMK
ncbi:MAG: thioesterase family protein [Nitrososphaeraceae archaeon]